MITLDEHLALKVFVVARQAERSFAFALSGSSGNRDDFREYYQGFRLEFLKEVVAELEEIICNSGWREGDPVPKRALSTFMWPWFLSRTYWSTCSRLMGGCPLKRAELHHITAVLRTAAARIEFEPFDVTNFIESRQNLLGVHSIIYHHYSDSGRLRRLSNVECYPVVPHPQPAHLKEYTLAELGFME